jgi:hypothetical protein
MLCFRHSIKAVLLGIARLYATALIAQQKLIDLAQYVITVLQHIATSVDRYITTTSFCIVVASVVDFRS